MGKAGRWIKSFLSGKKGKEKEKKESGNQAFEVSTESPKTPIAFPATPKEKKRWSFRRSVVTKDINSFMMEAQNEQNKHSITVPTHKAALVAAATTRPSAVAEAAAIKIQSIFRSYLARKALCALKGLVKLQALVRGYLVRKQAALTFRCMQALLTVQARAQAQRIQAAGSTPKRTQKQRIQRRSPQDKCFRQAHDVNSPEFDRGMEEKIKTVEVVDIGELSGSSKSKMNYSDQIHVERVDHRYPVHYSSHHAHSKLDQQYQTSPVPTPFADMSPRAFSGYFEEYSFNAEQNSPQYYSAVSKPDLRTPLAFDQPNYADSSLMSHDFAFFPNYMANTQSFKAKARSQSAPKQRPDSYEKQPSRRKASIEGSNVPRGIRMQRSSSHVGSIANAYQFPWSIKLDRSTMSLKDSECGSTSTVLTDANYSRSLLAYALRNH